jgi:hypothetical protein
MNYRKVLIGICVGCSRASITALPINNTNPVTPSSQRSVTANSDWIDSDCTNAVDDRHNTRDVIPM